MTLFRHLLFLHKFSDLCLPKGTSTFLRPQCAGIAGFFENNPWWLCERAVIQGSMWWVRVSVWPSFILIQKKPPPEAHVLPKLGQSFIMFNYVLWMWKELDYSVHVLWITAMWSLSAVTVNGCTQIYLYHVRMYTHNQSKKPLALYTVQCCQVKVHPEIYLPSCQTPVFFL